MTPNTEKLMEMLRASQYGGPSWLLVDEVVLPGTDGRARRVDAIALGLTPGTGYACEAFELKVSRADFLHETKDKTKWLAARRYVDRFYLLQGTPGLAEPSEVPGEWGIIHPDKNGVLLIQRAAKLLNTVGKERQPLDRAFVAAVLRRAIEAPYAHVASVARREYDAGKREGIKIGKTIGRREGRDEAENEMMAK